MMPASRVFLPVTLVASLVACGSGGDDGRHDTWQATADTIGDTLVVHTISGSVWSDTVQLVQEMSIGVLEGEDEYMFGDVRAIAVSAAGEVYVLDQQVPVVRIYAPDGTYLRNLGRDGGGPGEYERPASLKILADGRVLVRDPGNGRINVYGPDDEPLPSWRLPSGGNFNTSRPMYTDGVGNTYTLVLLEVGRSPWEWTYGLARFTSTGEHFDTLRVPTWDFVPARVTAQRENSSSSTSVPFTPSVQWTYSPLGYFVGGVSSDYRIDLYREDEPHLRIEREGWIGAPVLAAERAERERAINERFNRQYGSWRWNGPGIPDTKPPFGRLSVDQDGRIWAQIPQRAYAFRSQAETKEEEDRTGRPQRRYREHPAFDVFDSDGRFLGAVRVPDEFRTSPDLFARGDTVWAVTRDELDVPRVVRYRMLVGRAGDR